jgi:hypothetical protein
MLVEVGVIRLVRPGLREVVVLVVVVLVEVLG